MSISVRKLVSRVAAAQAVVFAVLAHGKISLNHYNDAAISDCMKMYDASTWGPALQDAWNAVSSMASPALYMLQVESPVSAALIESVESVEEIQLDHFAPPDMFFFFATKAQATALRSAAGVADVQAVPAALKIAPSLRLMQRANASNSAEQAEVLIELSPGSKANMKDTKNLARVWQDAVRNAAPGSSATFEGKAADVIALQHVKGTDLSAALSIVSDQPEAFLLDVTPRNSRIDPAPPEPFTQDIAQRRLPDKRSLNDDADDITQSGEIGFTPFRAAGLDGANEVIGIADSGLDDNSCFFNANRNLQRDAEPDFNQRKVVQYIAFADGVAGEENDHGTHVAGSVAGQCTVAAGTKYDGMAPAAKIHFFDIGNAGQPFLDVPRNLQTGLFPFAKEATAAIHTNSWGSSSNRYTFNARDVDAYSVANEEFVILVAAGNDGQNGRNTVGSPATAKNCIAVGASVNKKLGSIEDIASFSSIGPTADGRIKPDVVAPGHNVLSAASERTCAITSQSGTSMATPVCAGSVALVRQYFREGFYPSGEKNAADAFIPSGALLKAIIVHSGRQMMGNVRGDSYPGIVQGFGRVDLDSVLKLAPAEADRGTLWLQASKVGVSRVELREGETFTQTFKMNSVGIFKATLVWMDPPSSVNARTNLVNDLDLRIVHRGTSYFPNGGISRDTLNNVEMIEVAAMGDSYTVSVTATSIRSGTSQPYALVVTGPFQAPLAVGERPSPPAPGPSPTPPPMTYRKIDQGTCASNGLVPILDLPTCQIAATLLDFDDKTATRINGSPRPEGCYFKGRRLYLSVNPENTGRGVVADRQPICKQPEVKYEKISSGTCDDRGLFPIWDGSTCEAAALELGLGDQSVSRVTSTPRPEGCYYKATLPGNALFLATNPGNAGRGAAGDREPICQAQRPSRLGFAPSEGVVNRNVRCRPDWLGLVLGLQLVLLYCTRSTI